MSNVKAIKGTIKFTVDEQHPDYKYLTEDQKHEGMTFSDTYYFDLYDPVTNFSGRWEPNDVDGMQRYMKHDLALVAGGGYSTDHIHNVKYSFQAC